MKLVEIPSRAGLDKANIANGNGGAMSVKKKCNHSDSFSA